MWEYLTTRGTSTFTTSSSSQTVDGSGITSGSTDGIAESPDGTTTYLSESGSTEEQSASTSEVCDIIGTDYSTDVQRTRTIVRSTAYTTSFTYDATWIDTDGNTFEDHTDDQFDDAGSSSEYAEERSQVIAVRSRTENGVLAFSESYSRSNDTRLNYTSWSSNGDSGTDSIATTLSWSYHSGTSTSLSNGSVLKTTTATRASTYRTTSGSPGTGSSADTYTTSTGVTTTNRTETYYLIGTYTTGALLDTIVHGTLSDWLWKVTTTGTGAVTDVGDSFESTTISITVTGTSISFGTAIYTGTPTTSYFTYTQTTWEDSTVTLGSMTTTISTYRTAGPASGSMVFPLPSTTYTATITHTTTSAVTVTFQNSITSEIELAVYTDGTTTYSTASTATLTTTLSDGTMLTTISYSEVKAHSFWTTRQSLEQSTAEGDENIWEDGDTTYSDTFDSYEGTTDDRTRGKADATVIASFSSVSGDQGGTLTHLLRTVGDGFQAYSLIGRDQPYGTNLSLGFSVKLSGTASAWPNGPRTPFLSPTTESWVSASTSFTSQYVPSDNAIYLTSKTVTGTATDTSTTSGVISTQGGPLASTLKNVKSTTAFGGYGWSSTEGTTLQNTSTAGAHRATTVDNSTWGTTILDWKATSTYSLSAGRAIVMDQLPVVHSTSATSPAQQYTTWRAFESEDVP